MEEKIKQIIAGFIKVPGEHITADTKIDRSAVGNSIVLHRMYAKLAEEGLQVQNYTEIKTVGALLQQASASNGMVMASLPAPAMNGFEKNGNGAVGIDMEIITALPRSNDFREEEFYKMNFSPSEIAYCILQPDPYASFAGLFAAKEAIIKADNAYRNTPFSAIEISHEADGKPVFGDYLLSISHTNDLAIAVAVRSMHHAAQEPRNVNIQSSQNAGRPGSAWLWLFCILVSVAALIIALTGK